MKNVIEYYYGLNNINIGKYKNEILIKSNNQLYLFKKIENESEVLFQYELTKENNQYYKFIVNREGKIFTRYQNYYYVLLKIELNRNTDNNILEHITNNYNVFFNKKNKINWELLWRKKCDFIEYQQFHIQGKYPLIDESIDYYIGLTENAICYLKYNLPIELDNKLYLSHKRVNEKNFFDPLNTKLDYRERDLSEYLKHIFFTDEYKNIDIEEIIKSFRLDKVGAIRLYARMLYPSYYYDTYWKIINEEIPEQEIKKIVTKSTEYEKYLKKIISIINKDINIAAISWI